MEIFCELNKKCEKNLGKPRKNVALSEMDRIATNLMASS